MKTGDTVFLRGRVRSERNGFVTIKIDGGNEIIVWAADVLTESKEAAVAA